MNKKVFLMAYDKVNLGDDLFIRYIANRYPKDTFTILSNKENKENFKDVKNLEVIDIGSAKFNLMNKIYPSYYPNFQHKMKKQSDAVVYIGGSIFMEYPTWENGINWWNFQTDNYPFYVLGANFGPYKSEEYKEKMGEIFGKLKDICFRDKYSAKLFEGIDSVRMAPDILFGQEMPKQAKKDKQIFVSVINCEKKAFDDEELLRCKEPYEKWLVKEIKNAIEKGYNVVLSSFCKEEGDEEVCNIIQSTFEEMGCGDKISTLYYDGKNYRGILKEIAASTIVVSARFHGVVLGLLAESLVLPVIYSKKTTNVLKDIGFLQRILDLKDMDESVCITDVEKDSNVNALELFKMSAEHFKKLDEILK